jgi:hypothetical protein
MNQNINLEIGWRELSYQPRAIDLLLKNQDKIYWPGFSCNTSAVDFLSINEDKINWSGLSENIAAMEILKKHKDEINWSVLSENEAAEELFKEHPEKVKKYFVQSNKGAINFILDYVVPDCYEICIIEIEEVEDPSDVDFLLQTHLARLSSNENAMDFLLQHPKLIDFYYLSSNTDYRAVKLCKEVYIIPKQVCL